MESDDCLTHVGRTPAQIVRHLREDGDLQSLGFVPPLLREMTEWVGGDLLLARAAFEDARRRAGIAREAVWIQSTPNGDFVVVYTHADDLAPPSRRFATSEDPFDRWFREHVRQVHGVALEEVFAPPEQVLDFRSEAGLSPSANPLSTRCSFGSERGVQ